MGGTRMGFDIIDSVVDKDLKIHNLDNLFINGSSTFRSGGHSHPTYTIVKLAVRLGNHLSKL
jgi:choline dehydrogenase-like flavoprotein